MEPHIDFRLVGQAVAFVLMALTGGIAWGKLNERVKKHDVLAEGCRLENYMKKADCVDTIERCPGATHSAETYNRVVRIEDDLGEIKQGLTDSDTRFHESQLSWSITIARMETTLGILLAKNGVNYDE